MKFFSWAKSWATNKIEEITAKFSVSPNILDHLGLSAYNSIQKSLVELISNSYDADATEVKISIPKTVSKDSEIVIEDNGEGMTKEDFKNNYLYIGRNRRKGNSDITTRLKRHIIGHKGIGKLAGFGIAETVRIESIRNEIFICSDLKRDDFQTKKTLSRSSFNVEIHKTTDTNFSGTRIILKNLKQNLKIPELKFLRRYLKNHLPDKQNFTISVNNKECSVGDILGEKQEFNEYIEAIEKRVSGFYIITNSNTRYAGLAVRVRGRLVTKHSFFDSDVDSFRNYISRKFTGEVNADFMDDIQFNSQGQSLINTTRDGFIEGNKTVEDFNHWAKKFINKILEKEKRKSIDKRLKSAFDSEEVKKRLERLPNTVQAKARKMISDTIPKLGSENQEDQQVLIDIILRYFESNALKELLNAIVKAESQDIERLSEMIAEWGVREVSGITEIVTQQIQIISRLSDLVNDPKTIEKKIHKIFETNIWLLSEKYKLWSSNRQLKKILDKNLDEKYRDNQHLRPDIICRTSDNKVVIIEFKRPSETIKVEHLIQAIKYRTIIKSSMPNMKNTTIYLIGKKYASEITDNKEEQSKAGNFVYSFSEILNNAENRFENILKILNKGE